MGHSVYDLPAAALAAAAGDRVGLLIDRGPEFVQPSSRSLRPMPSPCR
jgi:hypothetical protein